MGNVRFHRTLFALLALMLIGDRAARPGDTASRPVPRSKNALEFEANVGQHGPSTRFTARRSDALLVLDDAGASLVLGKDTKDRAATTLTFRIAGGRTVEPVASSVLPTKSHYLLGNDATKWHRDVPSYGRVTYPSVADGVDLVFHGEEGQVEYDLIVAPETDPSKIVLAIGGAQGITKTPEGDLRIKTATGDVVQQRPRVYQENAMGGLDEVASSYRVADASSIGFEVAAYDRSRPLVIDPVIVTYSNTIGTAATEGDDLEPPSGSPFDPRTPRVRVTSDAAGNAYLVSNGAVPRLSGSTRITGTFVAGGITPAPEPGGTDVFVTKLSPTGAAVWRTYIGGENADFGRAIALDAAGQVYVTGATDSSSFPTAGAPFQTSLTGSRNAFLVVLSADGSTANFSSYLRPTCPVCNSSSGEAIALTGSRVHVAGKRRAKSTDEAFVLGFDITATPSFAYEQVLGAGWMHSLAVDGLNRVYAVGELSEQTATFPSGYIVDKTSSGIDAVLVRLSSAGVIDYGTTIGSTTSNDHGLGVAVGANGQAYVAGYTIAETGKAGCNPAGNNFPATPGAYQTASAGAANGFVAKLDTNTTGTPSLAYATFLGGNGTDGIGDIAVDSSGNAWLSGKTSSTSFPFVPAATKPGGDDDGFYAVLSANGGNLLASYGVGSDTNNDAIEGLSLGSDFLHLAGTVSPATTPEGAPPPSGPVRDLTAMRIDLRVSVLPASAILDAGATQTFVANGGIGFGYTFSLSSSGGGGTINPNTGAYTAGTAGGQDVILVTDAVGRTGSATVTVTGGPTEPLVLTPLSANTFPKGTLQFNASGGTPPYAFTVASNPSGGSIGVAGTYIAGTRGGVTDIIRLSDAKGAFVTATVVVGPNVSLTPAQASVAASGTVAFNATGGAGAPYTFTASDGTIAADGTFTAPSSFASITITAKDRFGNQGTASVSVGGAIAISPVVATSFPKGSVSFTAFGGTGAGFTWRLTSAPSRGTISNSGTYVAGPVGGVTDLIEVTDPNGNRALAQVQVGPALTVSPAESAVASGAKIAFSISGGSGTGYKALSSQNESGATFDQNGIYIAGPNNGTDRVTITDSVGNEVVATVVVTAAPPPPPPGSSGGTSSGTGGTSSSSSGGSGPGTGAPASSGITPSGPTVTVGGDSGGCATTGGSSSGTGSLLVMGVALVLGRMRRRTRR